MRNVTDSFGQCVRDQDRFVFASIFVDSCGKVIYLAVDLLAVQ